MRRALSVISVAPAGVDTVSLDLEGRRKRRHVVQTKSGEEILIDLSRAPQLVHGQGLVLEDGVVIGISATTEPLLEICAKDLVKIAWHLGNRHLPTEIRKDVLLIRPDHVIEAMLLELGATVRKIEDVFEPEAGAYGHHDHGHG